VVGVLSQLARVVHTIERVPALGEQAQLHIRAIGYKNVFVHIANGTLGLPSQSPFDAIVVTAGAEQLPKPYAEQLADGGHSVIPLGATTKSQRLVRFTKRDGQLEERELGGFAFVPLIGEYGWNETQNW